MLAVPNVAFADLEFDVRGVDSALKRNVEIYLGTIAQSGLVEDFRFQSLVSHEAQTALQALGYFDAKIDISIREDRNDTIVTLDIDAGEPVHIEKVDIKVTGAAKDDPAFIELLKSAPKVGEVLNQGQYDSFKSSIQSLAARRGYFDFQFNATRLEVSTQRKQAFIILDFDSGIRYNFGKVTFKNSQIQQSRLESMLTFKEGEPYAVNILGKYNQDLSNTGWFSYVLVEAELDDLVDGTVPITIDLIPAERNHFEVGVGYSTETGARFKLGWNKPWFNSRGHSINTSLYVSDPKQTIQTTYKVPLQNVDTEFYTFQLGIENLKENDTQSMEISTTIARYWKYQTGWQREISLRWLHSNFTQAGIDDVSNLILPGVRFSRVRTDGRMMPLWGDGQSIFFETASTLWGADLDLYYVLGSTAWIRSPNENNRFITKLKAGGVFTDNFEATPPSLRFFVGGDNSIRGYGYESISPVNNEGQLEGGSYMSTASLEYNYRISGNWWGAAFVDVGDSWTTQPSWKVGAGLGVRWQSPVGPVRIDLAHGFENTNNDVVLNFSIGPEL